MRDDRWRFTPCLLLSCWMAEPAVAQQEISTLEPVVVTSTRMEASIMETPASVSVVEGYRMREARMGAHLTESLNGIPGLQLQNRENQAQDMKLSIRGFGARSSFGVRGVRLYVDGIPATMPDGQGQTSNIDIASIDHVEVLRGPFSALHGNSSGGVVQVFTEEGGLPPDITVSSSAGSHGAWNNGVKARGLTPVGDAELDYVLSVNRYISDGYRDHSASRRNQGNAKLGLQLDDDTRLSLIINSVDLKADDPLGLNREDFENDPRSATANAHLYNTHKSVRQTQGGLIFDKRLNESNSLRALFYYGQRDTRQYMAIPAVVQSAAQHSGGVIDLERRYAGADLRWQTRQELAGRPFTLITGLSYDELRESRYGYENFSGGRLGVQGGLRRDESNKVWNLDPYVQASWRFADRWTLEAGMRYSHIKFDSQDHYIRPGNGDDSGKADYDAWLPVAALRYAPSADLSFYISAGRGFETPTFNEISYRGDDAPGLNFDLAPSINASIEAGMKARVAGGMLGAAVYHSRTRDEIVTAASAGGRTTYQNAGRTRRTGVELSWTSEWESDLRAQLAYTWLDARYRDDCTTTACLQAGSPDKHLRSGNRIPGIAKQAFYVSLDWLPEEGFRAGVDGRYLSSIPVNDGNTEAAPSYFVAGAHAGYVWAPNPWHIGVYARVDNLFDKQYAGSVIVNEGNQRYYEPAPGRNWSAGLNINYVF